MKEMKQVLSVDRILLFTILCVAAFLRFYRFWDIPMTYDELSALSRLRFDNLTDLIHFGILPDGHPAGVQVFLYYWTTLSGMNPFYIKMPFLLLSLFSLLLIYKIAKLWFNSSVGLLSVATAAAMQVFVMYGQMARPYSPALFLTLLTVYFWSRLMFSEPKLRMLLAYALSAALASYMHHFALLFVIIVGFTGFFFLEKKNEFTLFSRDLKNKEMVLLNGHNKIHSFISKKFGNQKFHSRKKILTEVVYFGRVLLENGSECSKTP